MKIQSHNFPLNILVLWRMKLYEKTRKTQKTRRKPRKPIDHKPKEVVNKKTCIIPTIKRYFYISKFDIHLNSGSNISVNLFVNDSGVQTNTFTKFKPNGYINLYINGVMQEGECTKCIRSSLTIKPIDSTISAGTPIIIESIGFFAKIH